MRIFWLIAAQGALVGAAAGLVLEGRPSPAPEAGVPSCETTAGPPVEPVRLPVPVELPAPPRAEPAPPADDCAVDAAFAAAHASGSPIAALLARARLDQLRREAGLRADQVEPLARLLLAQAERDVSDRACLNPRLRNAAAGCRGWYRSTGPERAEGGRDILPVLRRVDPELDRLLSEREAYLLEARREVSEILDSAQLDALARSGAFELLVR